MRQIIVALLVGIVGMGTGMWGTQAAEEAAPAGTTPSTPAPAAPAGGEAAPAGGGAAAGGACCKAGDTTPPLDLIKATPQAGLHNPYNGQIDAVAEEGHKKYLSFGCNGCHGGRSDPTDVPFQHLAPAADAYYGGGAGSSTTVRVSRYLHNPGYEDELGRRERKMAGLLCTACGATTY